ncbi:MAG: hypothetical protein KGL39_38610 [Patescibacteria group bacterium]|nr:hypothetical protein [Patescibacteria group bacterium]
MSQRATSDNPPADRCPECEKQGRDVRARCDYRVLVGGRGIYRCPECGTSWQDADETPTFSDKDVRIR